MRLWTVDNVAAWVSGLPLSRDYGEDFRAEGIDGSCLDSLTSEELKNIGVMKIGDRLKILDKLRTVKVAEKLFSPSCSLERTQRLKGGGQLVVSQDPADHALWGPMHKKGQIPGTSVQWAQWYVKLDQLKADDELWLNFVQNLSAGAGDGVVDGCFFWGDFVVVDSVNPRGGGKGGVETTLDSMFDLTPLRIQQIFNRFDREGNLSLSLGELGMAFKHQGLSKVEKSLKDIVRVVDCNSDGRLTLPEFALALTCLKMADLLNAPHAKRKVKSSRLCVLDYCVEEATLLDVEDPVRFMFKNRAPGFIRWLQVRNATRLTMLLLSIKYHLHPLGVEDSLALLEGSEEQTKVDRYGSHFYVGLVFFYLTSTSPRVAFSTANISLFIAGAPKWDTLISILHGKQPPATARKDFRTSSAKSTEVASDADIWSILQENITTAHCRTRENKSDFLMQEILAACIQELKPIMQAYRQRIAQLHGTLLHEQVKFSKLAELSWISLELGELHRNIRPMKHVLRQLMEDATIAAECKMYLKDLQETIDQVCLFSTRHRTWRRH
ncbi:hypothetical protein DIPPA_17496 [Diplonema papillatum]|nr:hypothetical protein DIPPA_17496 [Diplonema papillatum]